MNQITFKQYLESKQTLREAAKKVPRVQITHKLIKYGKIPIKENDAVEYIKVRPKDIIEVWWVYNEDGPIVEGISLNSRKLNVIWGINKITKWVQNNTIEIPII